MDLDNKTKLLQLAKRAQEDAEKEVARSLRVSISILYLYVRVSCFLSRSESSISTCVCLDA